MKLKVSRKIFAHVDCDSFFASCEVLKNPALKYRYVCVGSEIVIAASYNAKKLGVKCGTPLWEAQKILRGKNAYFCGIDMSYYQEISQRLMIFLRENTLDVRKFSIDEAFVEITGIPEMRQESLEQYIANLQQEILKKIGIPVSIGVSNTRLRAKIFSKIHKPFGNFIALQNYDVSEIFTEMSFREIPFIGGQTAKKLDFYITSISDYIGLGYHEIVRRFGKNGGMIWLELSGVESMSFAEKMQAKSVGRSRAFNKDMTGNARILLRRAMLNLERLEHELYEKNTQIRHIRLLLIDRDWKNFYLDYEFPDYISDHKIFAHRIKILFDRLYISGKIYRKTGVFSHDIRSRMNKQLSLFESINTDTIRSEKLEKILHDISEKYGEEVLRIGCN